MRDRLRAEQAAWDQVAASASSAERAAAEAGWADVTARLLDWAGVGPARRVLDCGCGPGSLSRAALARGAQVWGFDVSAGMLREARTALAPGAPCAVVLADFGALPFADASFDAAVGMFVLHHVELAAAATELGRVLRPGAAAVFLETWQANPAIRAARALRGRAGIARHGTADERPLAPADLGVLRDAGFEVRLEFPELTLFRLIDTNVLQGRLPRASAALRAVDVTLERVPALRRLSYHVAILLRRL